MLYNTYTAILAQERIMDYDKVMITLDKETNQKIVALEAKYQLSRGRSAVIRMAVAELWNKVIGGENENADKEKIAQV